MCNFKLKARSAILNCKLVVIIWIASAVLIIIIQGCVRIWKFQVQNQKQNSKLRMQFCVQSSKQVWFQRFKVQNQKCKVSESKLRCKVMRSKVQRSEAKFRIRSKVQKQSSSKVQKQSSDASKVQKQSSVHFRKSSEAKWDAVSMQSCKWSKIRVRSKVQSEV